VYIGVTKTEVSRKKTGFAPWLSAAAMQRLLPQPAAAAGTAAMQPQQVII